MPRVAHGVAAALVEWALVATAATGEIVIPEPARLARSERREVAAQASRLARGGPELCRFFAYKARDGVRAEVCYGPFRRELGVLEVDFVVCDRKAAASEWACSGSVRRYVDEPRIEFEEGIPGESARLVAGFIRPWLPGDLPAASDLYVTHSPHLVRGASSETFEIRVYPGLTYIVALRDDGVHWVAENREGVLE